MGTMLHNRGLHISFHDLWQVAIDSGGNRCRKSTVDSQFGKPCISFSFSSLPQIDADGSGYINLAELGDALEVVGIKLPSYKVRQIITEHDLSRDQQIDFEEFKVVSDKAIATKRDLSWN